MTVGIVIVSHSEALARGVVELCAQMAAEVAITAAGGTDDGGIGTSLDKTMAAIAEADTGAGAVILADLGSAEMTAQSALEFLDTEQAEQVRLADAPLVEGALAAATTAAGGADLEAVLAAAEAAGTSGATEADTALGPAAASAAVVLPNPLGLHARPAGQVVAAVRSLDVQATITNTASGARARADSLMALAKLEAIGGTAIRIDATGPDAEAAVARVATMAESGFGEQTGPSPTDDAVPEPAGAPGAAAEEIDIVPGAVLRGVSAVPGLALGPAARPRRPTVVVPDAPAQDADTERRRLANAQDRARDELRALASEPHGDVFSAHLELLDDPALETTVEGALAEGAGAPRAWEQAVDEQARALEAARTAAFAERAADVRDVGDRVLRSLLGEPSATVTVPAGAVVLADELAPSEVPVLAGAGAAALALGRGGRTGHVAVLARSLSLPLVVGLGPVADRIAEGTVLIVDGASGEVVVEPDEATRRELRTVMRRAHEQDEAARAAAAEPGRTADGMRIVVSANVTSVGEAEAAVANGAEGVGLLRTEFLFADRPDLPTEDEQVRALSAVCEAMDGRPVIVRTLDIGGDKPAPALDLDPVRNGFLGVRGLRLSLVQPDVFRTQLRALLRVAAAHRVSVMFPMVTTVDEVRQARAALGEARASLGSDRVLAGNLEEVGIMVEVPAAALDAAAFVEDVDFFSVGTNDLTAYTMAADRTLAEVAPLYRPDHPAVLLLIERLCEAAHAAGKWVGVCGEAAGDPEQAAALVRLGVRELSMAPTAIPAVKAALRTLDLTGPNAR